MTSETPDPEPVRFRPSKKRKTYRQRTDDDETQETTRTTENDIKANSKSDPTARAVAADYFPSDPDPSEPETHPAVIKARRRPLRGVGFRAGSRPGDVQTTSALVLRDQTRDGPDTAAVVAGINDRFTHQTGLVDDVYDRHMLVFPREKPPEDILHRYEKSRLSSRTAATSQKAQDSQSPSHAPSTTDAFPNEATAQDSTTANERKTVPVIEGGKIMEVDLQAQQAGQQTRQQGRDDQAQAGPAAKKPRLGPDGKPWRSRKRRGSDDVKRDQLVEAFLHENRLDVYDREPETKPITTDGEADARFAEEFQRQFMEDAAQRAQKKKKAKPTTAAQPSQVGKAGATEDVLKGPKLGGSRNSRAAVRYMLLKKEKEGKK